jgi:tetratricopeptide (TPR) repeat protein
VNALLVISAIYEDGRYLYGLFFLFQLFIIYNTQTRGTVLGLIGGLGLAGLLIAIFEKQNQVLRKSAIGVVIAAFVVVFGFLIVKNAPFIKDSPTLSRFSSISLSDPTTESRFILWHMAWEGVTSSPKTFIIGWGQESFNYVFNKYYDPRLYNQEQWFDRSHDIFFDWFVAGGLLGVLGYFAIFGTTIWYIWKPRGEGESEDNEFSVAEKSLLTGMLIGYLIHNIFVFDNITSYLYYVLFVAYVYARRTLFATPRASVRTDNRFVAPVALVALVLVIYFVNVPALLANTTLIQALTAQNDVTTAVGLFQKAISYNSYGNPEAREQIFSYADEITTQIAQTQDQTQLAALKGYQAQVFALMDTEVPKQLALTPNDARYYILPGAVYNHAGDYAKALPLLQKAAILSPDKQSILFELASAYLGSGESQLAENTLKTAYEADTSDTDAQLLYATGAIYNKDTATATALLQNVPEATIAANDAILQAYYYAGDYQMLVNLWQIRVAADPTNGQNHVSLAAAYLLIKDNKDAIAEIEKAEAIDPTFKAQGDQYIQQINSGQV